MDMRPFSTTKQIAYGAMAAALCALCLLAAGTLPTMRLAFLFLSSLFVYVLTERKCYAAGVASFAAAAALGLLIVPNKLILAPYIGLLGHFGIVKPALVSRVNSRGVLFLLLMGYSNICTAATALVCIKLFSIDPGALLPFSPLWLIPVAEVAIAAFIVLYGMCQRFYSERLSRHIK